MSQGKAFCATTETKAGIEAQWERNTGIDVTIINIVPDYTMTSNLNNYWFIPYTSEQPERVMQVLNEMYTNPDVANLLIYGIEGKYYEFVDEENDVIDYPEGVTSEDLGWTITAWHFPNELIAHKWVTDGPDIWKETIQFNEDCHPSQAKGFVWDSTDVTNEIVACTTVKNKYKKRLDCGDVDPDTVWEQINKASFLSRAVGSRQDRLLVHAERFVKYSGRELYCGEFGVIDFAPEAEAVKWLRDFITLCEKNGIGHAMWNYKCLDFEIVDESGTVVRPQILELLKEMNCP